MYRTHGKITQLSANQVFVFGSNRQGFHAAGAAGLAMRGESANTWRQDEAFRRAMAAPPGSPLRRGRWAVLGVAEGFQEGREGQSYAIPTVDRPGAKRSIPLDEILASLVELGQFAALHPELEFLCCVSGGGLNGYTVDEFRQVYATWIARFPPPTNISMPSEVMEGLAL